jgi:hypothetical protein
MRCILRVLSPQFSAKTFGNGPNNGSKLILPEGNKSQRMLVIQQPLTIGLVISLTRPRALGLTVSPPLLARRRLGD